MAGFRSYISFMSYTVNPARQLALWAEAMSIDIDTAMSRASCAEDVGDGYRPYVFEMRNQRLSASVESKAGRMLCRGYYFLPDDDERGTGALR